MTANPKISIVILGYNRKDDIRVVLNQLRHQTYKNFETIVVDNNSTDGSPQMIRSDFPEVYLIPLSSNRGISEYNIGFLNAKGEIIVTLNNDSYPEKDMLEEMITIFQKEPHLAIIACRILDPVTKKQLYPYQRDQEQTEEWSSFLLTGAGIRKKVLDDVGYLPKSIFLQGSENDLSIRVIDAGYQIGYFPNIVVCHRVSPRSHRLYGYYVFRSYYWFIWRRYPFWKAVNSTIGIFFILFSRAMRERRFLVYLKSTLMAFWNLPKILKERKTVSLKSIRFFEKQQWRESINFTDIMRRKVKNR